MPFRQILLISLLAATARSPPAFAALGSLQPAALTPSTAATRSDGMNMPISSGTLRVTAVTDEILGICIVRGRAMP